MTEFCHQSHLKVLFLSEDQMNATTPTRLWVTASPLRRSTSCSMELA
jgi:hypothetical protein